MASKSEIERMISPAVFFAQKMTGLSKPQNPKMVVAGQ
jgi:hypothetical protein